jgi:hypothetical protein
MYPIQAEMDPAMSLTAQLHRWQRLTFQGKDHREVPIEDVHVQPTSLGNQGIQELTQIC